MVKKSKVTNGIVQSEGLPTFVCRLSLIFARGIREHTGAGSTPAFVSYPHPITLRGAPLASTVLSEQAVQSFFLPDFECTRLDARMVHTQKRVDVIHGLSAHISKLLDLRRGIFDLGITELQPELLDAGLDCVPTGQAMSDRDVAREAKILRFEDFIGRRVVE